MIKYSLALLAATAVLFSGCSEDECCGAGLEGPVAVISTASLSAGILNGSESSDDITASGDLQYAWTVDGETVSEDTVLSAGTYNVCLTVTDSDGLSNQTCEDVTITNAVPTAAIDAQATCTPGETVDVAGAGTDTDGEITAYAWTGLTSTTDSGSFVCPDSGSQTVCLTVTDDAGADSAQVCESVNVVAPATTDPVAVITPIECNADNIAEGELRVLCGNSYDTDAIDTNAGGTDLGITRCEWTITAVDEDGVDDVHPMTFVSFPDETKNVDGYYNISGDSTATEPKFIGEQLDYKLITLTVTDNDGETAEVTKKMTYTGDCGELVDP